MVKFNPFGVGLGDWQTMYPVYRKVNPDTAFDERFQVRRAHSDHVQILGEAGWPGLILWSAFLVTVVARTAMTAVRRTRPEFRLSHRSTRGDRGGDGHGFLHRDSVQQVSVLSPGLSRRQPHPTDSSPTPDRRALSVVGPWLFITLVVAAAAGASIVGSIQTEKKLIASATSTSLFLEAADASVHPRTAAVLLEEATTIGETWTRRYGHWKTLFRDHLALARSAALTGHTRLAREEAQESLRLQPFNPQGLRLMVELSTDPDGGRSLGNRSSPRRTVAGNRLSGLAPTWRRLHRRGTLMARKSKRSDF